MQSPRALFGHLRGVCACDVHQRNRFHAQGKDMPIYDQGGLQNEQYRVVGAIIVG